MRSYNAVKVFRKLFWINGHAGQAAENQQSWCKTTWTRYVITRLHRKLQNSFVMDIMVLPLHALIDFT